MAEAGPDPVAEYVAAQAQSQPVPRRIRAAAVRRLLAELAERAPGRSVEVRIPPDGVVQAVPGPPHRRGTPGAVVEMTPDAFLALALDRATWQQLTAQGAVLASGERADLSQYFPLRRR
ncbi:MAG: hypothetical protein KDC39_03445 [Actinobacteria bacterium]|nr:hypothetical protein [Actinomycetota bacterium]